MLLALLMMTKTNSKMKKVSFVLLVFSLVCCQSPEIKNENSDGGSKPPEWYRCVDLRKFQFECLDIDSISISGGLPTRTTIKELFSLLGSPAKAIPRFPKFINSPKANFDSKLIYYKNINYFTRNENAYIKSINFDDSDIQVTHPKIKLNKNTTIFDLYKIFPLSSFLPHGGGETGFSGFIQLRVTPRWNDGEMWSLVFKKDKLVRLDYIEAD